MADPRKEFGKRWDYAQGKLDRESLVEDPLEQFFVWYQEASEDERIYDANAFALATADARGRPSVRTLLLRAFDVDGFTFFTNYDSAKGHDIAQNPQVSMLFPWLDLERQVRISGKAEKISKEDSEAYFASRPRGSCLSAWASPQSAPVNARSDLEQRHKQVQEEFRSGPIPLPPNWGGYRVKPHTYEFWQGRKDRLHDRFRYRSIEQRGWVVERLAP